jgi:hypothetical protein
MSLNFTQGDTAPDVTAVLHAEDDPLSPTDLSTATAVRFQMRLPEGKRYKVDAAATIDDAVAGKVSYAWGANDLSQPGTYEAQWEITWTGGKVQTTYPPVELVVRRQ